MEVASISSREKALNCLQKIVLENGFALVPTRDDKNQDFTYTVGLFETFQHPELVIYGLSGWYAAIPILRAICEKLVCKNHTIEDGNEIYGFKEYKTPLKARNCTTQQYKEFCRLGAAYYKNNNDSKSNHVKKEEEFIPMMQILWPHNKTSKFPTTSQLLL
jgi:hypothetical protein